MYNEELKRQFIDGFTDTQTRIQAARYFNKSARIESKYDEDVWQMPLDHLQETLSFISGLKTVSIAIPYKLLRQYIKFCKLQGFPVSDAIQSVKLEELDKIRSRMVGSPRHLADTLDLVFTDTENNHVNYVYRTYLWLAYHGFTRAAASKLTDHDVELNPMRIMDHRGAHIVYAEAVQDLTMAMELTQFKTRIGRGVHYVDRVPGHALLRCKSGSDDDVFQTIVSTISPRLTRLFQNTYKRYDGNPPAGFVYNLTFLSAYASGIFYRMYERERIGYPVDFSAEIDYQITWQERNWTTEAEEKRFRYEANYGLKNDYNRWKAVYCP